MLGRALLPVLLLCTALGAQTLVLGAEDGAGPWGQPDGSGCGNDLVRAAYQAVGVRVELKILPYARAKDRVLAGDLAGCFSMSPSPDLLGKVLLSREPLYTCVSTFVRRAGELEHVTALDGVPLTATVGIVNDYEYPEGIRRLEQRGVTLAPNRSEVASLEMLTAGRLTFAVLQVDALKSLEGLLAQVKAEGRLVPAFHLGRQGSYVAFSLGHPQGRWAKAKFDQGLARIKANGTLQKILKDWKHRGLRGPSVSS